MNLHNFAVYLQESTVHGIRYFVDGENLFHRLVWMVIMACSVTFLGYLVHSAWIGWEEDPSISTIDRVKLSELDFPAITVCPDWATDELAIQTVYNMIEFDATVTNQLKKTMPHLMNSIHQMPEKRREDDELNFQFGRMRWVVDFTPESVTNLALRKTDMDSFVYNNEGNLHNNLFYKVDVLYMKNCEMDGPYCSFHNKIVEILNNIETQDWFSIYQEAHGTEDWVWNDDTFEYENVIKPVVHLDFEFLTDIILEEVLKIEDKFNKGYNGAESRTDLLLKSLETVDYESVFYDSSAFHEHLQKEEYDNYYGEDYGDYGKKFKRDVHKISVSTEDLVGKMANLIRKERDIEVAETINRDSEKESGDEENGHEENDDQYMEEDVQETEVGSNSKRQEEAGKADGQEDEVVSELGDNQEVSTKDGTEKGIEEIDNSSIDEGNQGGINQEEEVEKEESGNIEQEENIEGGIKEVDEVEKEEIGEEGMDENGEGGGDNKGEEEPNNSGKEEEVVEEYGGVDGNKEGSTAGSEEEGEDKNTTGGGEDNGNIEEVSEGNVEDGTTIIGKDNGEDDEESREEVTEVNVVDGNAILGEEKGEENGEDVGGTGESEEGLIEEGEVDQRNENGISGEQGGAEGSEEGGEEGGPGGREEGGEKGRPGEIESGGIIEEGLEEESAKSIVERGKKFTTLIFNLLNIGNSSERKKKRRKKRKSADKNMNCGIISEIPHLLGEMRDGAVFSLAKMKRIQVLEEEQFNTIKNIENKGLENCKKDRRLDESIVVMKPVIIAFDEFLNAKAFNDDLEDSSDNHCELPDIFDKHRCTCECKTKGKKLSIYNIFAAIAMLENKQFKLGGDVLSWYYNGVMDPDPMTAQTKFRVKKDIADEVINLDKKVLKDISKKDVHLGLRDFISNMAQPASIWKTQLEFPKLSSWNIGAKKEVFKLFNYDEKSPFRGMLELKMPNFENLTSGLLCKNSIMKENFTNYCKLVENLPDLQTIMPLMNLASYPSQFKDNIRETFSTFNKSDNPVPNLSYIPTCFFGENAEKFWNLKEYSELNFHSAISKDDYEAGLNVPYSDIYRYPKCRQFGQRPTEKGICHTFNGLALSQIIKSSTWLSAFKESFGGHEEEKETQDILKSGGIDKEGGFVFSLDTMQAHLITKKIRETSAQGYFNSFWIKVHKPGDLPIMSEDKSSWTKIAGHQPDMMTKYISLKGERVSHKDAFRQINSDTRKCKFPDEGDLKLFDYYSESNCKLECAWKTAEEICGCKPWYIPAEDGAETCFVLGNVCFQQIIEKLHSGKMNMTCDCEPDCIYSRYTISLQDKVLLERTSTNVWKHPFLGHDFGLISTDEMDGSDFTKKSWYNMGEYVKDKNFTLLPHEPLLDVKFPRPLVDNGYCWAANWWNLDEKLLESNNPQRNCEEPFVHPFAHMTSKDFLLDRQRNLFKVAVYYNPDQSVITKITKDAKMSISDKISWMGGMAGLFTGFSVISGIEILYWLWFKVLFHKKDHKVDQMEGDETKTLKREVETLKGQVEELMMKMKATHAKDPEAGQFFDAIFNDPAAAPKRPWSAESGDSMFG